MGKLFNKLLGALQWWLPSPFSIAILITFFVALLSWIWGGTPDNPVSPSSIVKAWHDGLWDMLAFAMQMVLMLVLGHVLALSKPVEKVIFQLVKYAKSGASAVVVVAFSTMLVAMCNWGLGLIFGAILARKVGEQASAQNRQVNYPLLGAAGYVGLMVWHGGLSGSAPLKVGESGHHLESILGIIGQQQTLFSSMNGFVTLALLLVVPLVFWCIAKQIKGHVPQLKSVRTERLSTPISGVEKMDYWRFGATVVGIVILLAGSYAWLTQPTRVLSPNIINGFLLGAALVGHGSFNNFLNASEQAIKGSTGIVIQFPLYAGIMGIMQGTGLIFFLSKGLTELATAQTLPVFTFFSAALVNVFVPSGGGQWIVQGPIISEAAHALGSNMPKNIMALAYGDQLTNMMQPFWALPLLGITGLKAKEIFPYSLIIMLVGLVIFLGGLLLF